MGGRGCMAQISHGRLAMEAQIDADTQNMMGPTTVEALRRRISEEEFETRLMDRRITTSNGRRMFRRYTELANLCNIRQARWELHKSRKERIRNRMGACDGDGIRSS